MHFGDKLRQLRKQKDWTQPQLAEAIGIEQSYLSKLENGKSIPSADIFQLILKVFDIKIEEMLEGIEASVLHRQLRQLPEVANFISSIEYSNIKHKKSWLIGSAVLSTLGIVFIISSYFGLIFSGTYYNYASNGVVLEGEPKEIFSQYAKFYPIESLPQKTAELTQRRNEKYLLSSTYRGNTFNIPVKGGSRTYKLYGGGPQQHFRIENRYLTVAGILFLTAGIFGFLLEKKLSRL